MSLGSITNSPGNLTVTGPNSYLYNGQSGVYSANGLYYAEFPDTQTGANALLDYLNGNIGSNDSNSITSPSELASYYLNGSYGPLQNTSANPNGNSWLSTVENAAGLGPNAQISQSDIPNIASGIEQAEGNGSMGNLFGSSSGSSTSSGGVSSLLDPNNNSVYNGSITSQMLQSVLGSGSNTTDAEAGLNTLSGSLNNFTKTLSTVFSLGTWERTSFVVLGIALAVIAVTVLIVENKTVQQTASRVAKVASVAA